MVSLVVGPGTEDNTYARNGRAPFNQLVLTGSSTDQEVWVSRRDPDLSRPVRGCEPLTLPANAVVTVADYEVPLSVPVLYEVTTPDGTRVVSQQVRNDADLFYPNDQQWSTIRGAVWLKHLTIPRLSMRVDLSNAESPVFKQARTVVEPLNRRDPVVLSDARRKAPTSSLDIRTWSLEESQALRNVLADNSVLLLQVPESERWGIVNWYVAIGDVTEERLWQEWAPFEGRVFHLPVEIVERPAGGVVYPDCCYWWKQEGMASYLAFAAQYPSYGQLSACDVNFVNPPDPVDNAPQTGGDNTLPGGGAYTVIGTAARTANAGTYGTLATTSTYGSFSQFADGSSSPAQLNAALPFVGASKTVTLTAGNKYRVAGQFQFFSVDQGGYLQAQLRLTAGATATVSSGTLLATSSPTRTYTAGERVNYISNDSTTGSDPVFVASASGQYTLAWVITGTVGSVSTTTDVRSTSDYQISIQAAQATTTTTGSPANNVTLTLQATLSAGVTYFVTGTQYFQNATQPVTFLARYVYGTATGTSPGLGLDPATVASIGSTATGLTSAGSFQATTSGVWSVVTVVSSSGNVDDGTDASGHGAILTIGTYV